MGNITIQDMFFTTQHICSWRFTPDMQLQGSNCPEESFVSELFLQSSSAAAIRSHFQKERAPLFVADRTGLVWMTAFHEDTVHVLGPVFTSELTENHLRGLCRQMSLAPVAMERIWHFIKTIPTISSYMASCYTAMLHYGITNEPILWNAVKVQTERAEHDDSVWGDVNWHGTWIAEQRVFESIRNARQVDLSKLTNGRIGNIGGGDPLRQVKNMFIAFAMLCSRAAIFGGVSPESAMNLSDRFMAEVESAETVQKVTALMPEMYRTFIRRVQKAKADQAYSLLVRACMDYVELHGSERITLAAVAQEVGYNEHYICRRFKAETGKSLIDYIRQQKIRAAEVLLTNPVLSVAEIGDRLGFSSQSYFSAVFKKQTGVGPTEYRQTLLHTQGDSRFQSFLVEENNGSTNQ